MADAPAVDQGAGGEAQGRWTYPPPPPQWRDTAMHVTPPAPPEGPQFTVFGVPEQTQLLRGKEFDHMPPELRKLIRDEVPAAAELGRMLDLLRDHLTDATAALQGGSDFRRAMHAVHAVSFNAHVCVNRLRPHEAREGMIAALEGEVARKQAMVAALKSAMGEVERAPAECAAALRRPGAAGGSSE